MPATGAFPAEGMALTTILVVSDLERSARWYEDVLGASPYRRYGGTSAVFEFEGSWLLLVVGGGPTDDKPAVTFRPPADADRADHAFTVRVPDCRGAYELLRARGAQFLAEPVDHGHEVRAFFRDPDGHLFEVSEVSGVGGVGGPDGGRGVDDQLAAEAARAEAQIAAFIQTVDEAGGRTTEVAAEVVAVVAAAWAGVEAATSGLPTNGLIAAMLEVGRQARLLTSDEPRQWQLHAASTLLSGLIVGRPPPS